MAQEVYRKPAAAAFLGISTRTLDRLDAAGTGPAKLHLSPGTVGYRIEALRAYLETCEARSQKAAWFSNEGCKMAHPEKPAFALTDGEMREALKTCPWRSPPDRQRHGKTILYNSMVCLHMSPRGAA